LTKIHNPSANARENSFSFLLRWNGAGSCLLTHFMSEELLECVANRRGVKATDDLPFTD